MIFIFRCYPWARWRQLRNIRRRLLFFSDVESIDAKGNGFHLMHYGDYKLAEPDVLLYHRQPWCFQCAETRWNKLVIWM